MSRAEEIEKAGGAVRSDQRLQNVELCLARRIGKKMAADVMDDISTASALESLEALIRQVPAPRQETTDHAK